MAPVWLLLLTFLAATATSVLSSGELGGGLLPSSSQRTEFRGRNLLLKPYQIQKLVREAEAVLSRTEDSKEAQAIAGILNNVTLSPVATVPSGCKVWCDALNQTSQSVMGVREAATQQPEPYSLVRAINDKSTTTGMDWDRAMSDELASVTVAGVWWSAKQRPVTVTLTTQASVDRLPQLYSQCKSWRGPLSAVMFLGLVQPTAGTLSSDNIAIVQKAALHVYDFFLEIEKDDTACKLDVMLVYEVYTESRALLLYPINVLRNLARLQASTPLIALIDVDMLVSRRFYLQLKANPGLSQQLMDGARAKTAYVLPAFETYGKHQRDAVAVADSLASESKAVLFERVKSKVAGPFDQKRFKSGHNWTLFAHWYEADAPYEVTYGHRYEPWVIVDRKIAPWHDSRFRGYGQNKIVHIAHLNSSGFHFVVLSDVFIVHRPHEPTDARMRLIAGKRVYDAATAGRRPTSSTNRTSIYGHSKGLFDDAEVLMARGEFQPVLDPATINCIHTLSWWQDKGPSAGSTAGNLWSWFWS